MDKQKEKKFKKALKDGTIAGRELREKIAGLMKDQNNIAPITPACSLCVHCSLQEQTVYHWNEHNKDYDKSVMITGALCGGQAYVDCKEVYNNEICKEIFYISSEIISKSSLTVDDHNKDKKRRIGAQDKSSVR